MGVGVNLVAVFLVSAGVLGFEVALTRVFALAWWHHFASLLIALALTGFGAAGSLLAALGSWVRPGDARLTAGAAWGAALAMWLVLWAAPAVGLEPLNLAWSGREWLRLGLVCLILVVPFLLAAAHIVLQLAWADRPARVYGANLAGSGAGCLAAALALGWLTPNLAALAGAGLTLAGSLAAAYRLGVGGRRTMWAGAAVLALLSCLLPPPLAFAPFKDRSAAVLAQGSRVFWRAPSLWGLVEVIGGPAFHFAPGLSLSCAHELPAQNGLFLDGDLAGALAARPGADHAGFVSCLLLNLALGPDPPDRVLVLHAGGGLAVSAALAAGTREVTAIEANPAAARVLRGDAAGLSSSLGPGLGSEPRARLVQDDPARYLASRPERYNLILSGDGTAWALGEGGGLSATPLLTRPGLGLLLDRLAPWGTLALVGPMYTPLRATPKLLITLAGLLRERGHDPTACLAVVRDWRYVLILVSPQGLSPGRVAWIRQRADALGLDISALPGLTPSDLNRFHLLPGEPLARAASLAAQGRLQELQAASPFDLRPATRDRPYFFNFFSVATLPLLQGRPGAPPLPITEWGLLFTAGGLVAALILAGLGVLLPLAAMRSSTVIVMPTTGCWQRAGFFALLGLGYMLAEITLLAEATYRLGRPGLSVPLVVGVFLAASGAGSLAWGARRPGLFAWGAALALPAALLGLRLLSGGAWVVGLCLAPAALLMGVPFAGGLAHLTGGDPAQRAWAFGVNGFFSVAGSLAASLLCLMVGHTPALVLAAACYAGAGVLSQRTKT